MAARDRRPVPGHVDRVAPSRTTWRPATTTSVTSAAVAAATSIGTGSSGVDAGQPHAVEPDGAQVGRLPGPQGRRRRWRRPAGPPGRCSPRRPVASRSSSSTARASSNRSATACESLPTGAGSRPRPGRRPGRRRRPGRARWWGTGRPRCRCAQQGDVAGGHVGAVHRGGGRAEHPVVVGQLGRGAAGGGQQASFSAGCSDRCRWSGTAGPGPGGDGAERRRVHRPDAVDRGAHGHVGVGGRHLLGPGRPALDVAVAEPPLHRVERLARRSRPAGSRCRAAPAGCRPAGRPRTRRRPCPPAGGGSGTRARW